MFLGGIYVLRSQWVQASGIWKDICLLCGSAFTAQTSELILIKFVKFDISCHKDIFLKTGSLFHFHYFTDNCQSVIFTMLHLIYDKSYIYEKNTTKEKLRNYILYPIGDSIEVGRHIRKLQICFENFNKHDKMSHKTKGSPLLEVSCQMCI